jgi:hypothetical protein
MATLTGEQLKDSYQSIVTIGDSITSDPTSGQLENGKGTALTAVGIGTDAPNSNLSVLKNQTSDTAIEVSNVGSVSATTTASFLLSETPGTPKGWFRRYRDGTARTSIGYDGSFIIESTAGTERMRIDASGNVGIGTSTTTYDSAKIGTGHKFLNVQAPSGSYAVGTLAGDTDINGDRIGYLTFVNENNSASYKYSAWIGAEVEGATANQQGGRLIFSTASDGSSGGPIERLLIDSDGKVGIGTLLPSTTLDVKGTMSLQATNSTNKWLAYTYTDNTLRLNYNGAGNDEVLIDSSGNVGIGTTSPLAKIHSVSAVEADAAMFSDGTYYTLAVRRLTSSTGGMITGEASSALGFGTDNTERMRIDSSGNILFGTEGVSNGTTYFGSTFKADSNSRRTLNMATSVTTAQDLVEFFNPSGRAGYIQINASTTSYVTSSDYRLKENVVEMTGALDRVDQLKPSRFNFIADADTTVDGFLAHEVADVVPEAITGEKDAVDDEGNPIYQGIDQSKLVPLLVGAIQELRAEIEQLKNQQNELEN